MKVSDIEAVRKKYGLALLKDANPELFQAELAAGPSTVFLSRTPRTSDTGENPPPPDEHATDE